MEVAQDVESLGAADATGSRGIRTAGSFRRTWRIAVLLIPVLLLAGSSLGESLSQNGVYVVTLPPSGSHPVSGSGQLISNQTVTFTAVGKPPLDNWSVNAGTVGKRTAANTIVLSLAPGSYTCIVRSNFTNYRTTPDSQTILVAVSPVNVTVTFYMVYNLTFSETGLPSFAKWNAYLTIPGAGGSPLNLGGAAGVNLTWREPNGTYDFGIQPGGVAYVATPQTGSVLLNGSSFLQVIVFTPPPPRFNVSLNESGLPQGTQWSAAVNGKPVAPASAPAPITFAEPNGSYQFSIASSIGFQPHPYSGSFVVAGHAVTVMVVFTAQPDYRVSFGERGLPGGTWTVSLNGTDNRSAPAGTNLTFQERNGSYSYSILSEGPYQPTPRSGVVNVLGASVSIEVTYSSNVFAVQFVEYGLVSGSWWVLMNGTNQSTLAGSGLSFVLPNGTYSYAIGSSSPGYFPTPAGGVVLVTGTPTNLTVTFSTGTTGGTVAAPPAKSKILSLLPYAAAGIIAVLGIFVLVRWLARRYEGREERAQAEQNLRRATR